MIRTLGFVLLAAVLLAGTVAIVVRPVVESESQRDDGPRQVADSAELESGGSRVEPPEPARPVWHRAPFVRLSSTPLYVERLVDELARLRSSPRGPFHVGPQVRLTGVMLEPTDLGRARTVTITPWPEERGSDPVLTFQVAAGRDWRLAGCFVGGPLPDLELPPGQYAVRVDGVPCVLPSYPGDDGWWLFPQGPVEAASIAVVEHTSGCAGSQSRGRWFRPVGEEYVAEDGACLTRAQVEQFRSRVLASSPQPGESVPELVEHPDAYLASLGFTDEVISARVATIRAACTDARWKDAQGKAPELPAEVDGLFDLHELKARLVDYLLQARNGSTQQTSLCIELPGDPWIHLGTDSSGPDAVPWYVVAGGRRWYCVDRELSRYLAVLDAPGGWFQPILDASRNWRDTVWSNPQAWGSLPAELNEALARTGLERVAGWAEARRRFQVDRLDNDPRPDRVLPPMELRVTHPGTIDTLYLAPDSNEQLDWTAVLSQYERAEQAAAAQPWLAAWKQEQQGEISVFLPLHIDHLSGWASDARRLWSSAGLEGTPDVAVTFDCRFAEFNGNRLCSGLGVLSDKGDLLILQSHTSRGPLFGKGLSKFQGDSDTGFAVVRAGAAPEIRPR